LGDKVPQFVVVVTQELTGLLLPIESLKELLRHDRPIAPGPPGDQQRQALDLVLNAIHTGTGTGTGPRAAQIAGDRLIDDIRQRITAIAGNFLERGII
jgi:hypothetical protein